MKSVANYIIVAVTITITLVSVVPAIEGLHCYECLAWKVDQPGTNERCRDDVPPESMRVDCNAAAVNVLDLNTGKIRTRVPGDTSPSARAMGDLVCVKVNGTESNTATHVVFRACAIARVDEELDGVCQIVNEEFHIPGYLTMKAGSKHFHCTSENCNTGPVSGSCGGGDGEGTQGETGSGTANSAPSIVRLRFLSYAAFTVLVLLAIGHY